MNSSSSEKTNSRRLSRRKGQKRRRLNSRRFGRFLFIAAASAALIYGAVMLYDSNFNHSTIYDNIYIDQQMVGGLTKEQALEKLRSDWQKKLDQVKIRLWHHDDEWLLSHEDIRLSSDFDQVVEEAYNIGRRGGFAGRIKEIRSLKENPVHLSSKMTYQAEALKPKLQEIAEELNTQPVDASVSFNPDDEVKFKIKREQPGRVLKTDLAIKEIDAGLAQGELAFSVELQFDMIMPRVTAADFEGKTEKLVTFGTDLSQSAPDRTHNIVLAASQFNGLVLQPGEILSFNEVVGERTAEKGYRSAPMIVADKSLQPAIGGGVSQASTTLYNASIRADLDVIEYQRHSFPVSYIDKGLDTTVNLPSPVIDIKVKNTKTSPVYIRTFYANKKIYFEMYGEPLPNGRTIRIRTEEYETVPAPKSEIRRDEAGKYVTYEDQQYVYVSPRQGYKVRVYREYLEDGKVVESELLDDHYYRPIGGIIYVGVKKRPAPEQTPEPDEGSQDNGE